MRPGNSDSDEVRAVAQATSALDDALDGADDAPDEADADGAGPVHPYVEALTGLPGVEHVAVVDSAGQRILGEWGGPAGSADPLLERARAAADRTGRRELSDVESTTASAFHLSRLVLAGPGHPESVWVAVRVGRAQGNLPWSRAALAGLDHPAGLPRIPVPRTAPRADGAVGPTDEDVAVPAQRIVPPPPVGRAALAAPTPPAAPALPVAPVSSAAPAPPAAPVSPAAPAVRSAPPARPETAGPVAPPRPAKAHVPLTARVATMPVPLPDPDPSPTTAETVVAEVATTVELALPQPFAPPEPAAAPSAAAPAAGSPAAPAPQTERRSSFAPVLTVLPPPSPVPDDHRTEEPAPMPAPILVAPDPAERQDDHADPIPAYADDTPGAPDPAVTADEADPGTDPDADPDEPRVMRRLIHGLRRRP